MTQDQSQKFGRFEVKRLLGRGAMGRVYLAEDPVIGREVAIKVVHAHAGLESDELAEIQGRFEREFRSAGTLSHPNIVTVYDVGKEGDASFIAMEYVAGESLEAVLAADRSFTFKEVSDFAHQLASALDYAHEQGVVHRDVKPANVMLTWDGRAKITDFGVAKLTSSNMTRTGTIIGTPAFMSPEQVTGREISGASDQFSLAVILYLLLTGERPFGAENPTTVLYKIVHQDPMRPQEINRDLPADIDETLLKALSKDPAERYGSCLELAEALRKVLGAAPADPALEKSPGEAPETKRGASSWLPAAALALVVVGAAGWFLAQELLGPSGHGGVEAPPPEPPEPEAVTASLEVDPGVAGLEIWLDGADTGRVTPATVDLSGPRGETRRLELRRDGRTLDAVAYLLGEEEVPDRWQPEIAAPGTAVPAGGDTAPPPPALETLEIVSQPPGARVLLDGAPAAAATPAQITVEPGRSYGLRLELEGHDAVGMTLDYGALSEEQRTAGRLFFNLKPSIPPGHLLVAADYPVRVTVGSKDHGTKDRHRIALLPGGYEVALAAPDVFFSASRRVQVESGQDAPITVPPMVEIRVTANPANCKVSIDGRFVDYTPLLDLPIVTGSHELLFEWPSLGKSITRTEVISVQNTSIAARPPE